MTAITARDPTPRARLIEMNHRPKLELYVSRGCRACERAERTLRNCRGLRSLVDLVVLEFGKPGVSPPAAVIGGPTTVFQGSVVALGTPDCAELVARIVSTVGREDRLKS